MNREAQAAPVNQKELSLPPFAALPAAVFQLANGLQVIHQEVTATPAVVVDVWVRAGTAAEPEAGSGMAHFLEHMIFKGTAKLAAGVFDSVIENQGGVTNAATSHDYAHYFMITPAQTLEMTLPLLAELLLHAEIPEAEFGRERDVVLDEIRRAEDTPDWQAYQALVESIYQEHPYGRPILGVPERLMERSPAELRDFHRRFYHPENMTVVVVGGVERSTALELVSHHFAGHQTQSTDAPANQAAQPSMTGVQRRSLELPRLEQARLLMAWRGPGSELLEHAYGLELLSVLLAGGRSSRLITQLREQQGLVQEITSSFSLQRESGLFTICAWLEPQHLDAVEALIAEQLQVLGNTPISPEELERCQRSLCNDYAFSTETPYQLAALYGYYSTIAQVEAAVTYPEMIRNLTAADLQY
ncbi:MAG TPA: pitrilysin family protein, partial [Candidatus Caenarcaniphilales bacterium]